MVFGIPTAEAPFVLDMATSAVTGGDVLTAASNEADLAPGIAVDARGEPTTDPLDVLRGGGAVLPFGGHKGLGLALTVEILNRALTGATGDPGDWGHVFVVFSLGLLGDEDAVRARAQAEVERLREAGARIPGHQTLANRDAALERGWVEIDDEVFSRLEESVG
jgi:delta1-piperideine-2-carboxylate reductase